MLRRVASRVPICRNLNHVPIDDHFFGLTDEEVTKYGKSAIFNEEGLKIEEEPNDISIL